MTPEQTRHTMNAGVIFTCDNCGETFESGWSDEEARAEADALWGAELERQGEAVVCDACHQRFLRWASERGVL